jgi:hypothetical protein
VDKIMCFICDGIFRVSKKLRRALGFEVVIVERGQTFYLYIYIERQTIKERITT